MSAYVVDREHIVYLVQAGRRLEVFGLSHNDEEKDILNALTVGNMLWQECIASVSYRYPSDKPGELPGPIDETFVLSADDFEEIEFPDLGVPGIAQIFQSCACYEYQSCEHPGWKESRAKEFIESLRAHAGRKLPGSDEAIWGAPPLPKLRGISLTRLMRQRR